MSLIHSKYYKELPYEVHAQIFDFCTLKEIFLMRQTCALFKQYVDEYLQKGKSNTKERICFLEKKLKIVPFSQLKLLKMIPSQVQKNIAELRCDEIDTLCKEFEVKLTTDSPEMQRLSSHHYYEIFKRALASKDFVFSEKLITNPKFRRISFWNFSHALTLAVKSQRLILLQKLLNLNIHYEDEDLSAVDEALITTCKWGLVDMFKIISAHRRFTHVDRETLSEAFLEAIKMNREDILKLFFSHPRFDELTHHDLEEGLIAIFEFSHKTLLEEVLVHPYFDQISRSHLSTLLTISALSSEWEVFKRFLCHHRIRQLSFIDVVTSTSLFMTKKTIERLFK